MVPTEDAIITRQMLYSALPVPATCAAFAIVFSVHLQYLVPNPHFGQQTTTNWDPRLRFLACTAPTAVTTTAFAKSLLPSIPIRATP